MWLWGRRDDWIALGPPMEVFGFDFHDSAGYLAGGRADLQAGILTAGAQ